MHTNGSNAYEMHTECIQIERREMEELKKYTGRFQALWDNYFWAKEQIEQRKNTIGYVCE